MPNGPFAKSTEWTRSLVLLLVLLVPFGASTASAASLEREITMLADEVSRLRSMLPGLGYPDPSPSELEELARTSPATARVAFDKAKAAFAAAADLEIKKAVYLIGHSIEISKTSEQNYLPRRQLLAELEAMYRARRQPVVGLFPEGPPSSRLAQGSFGEREFAFCDKTFAYLGTLFKSVAHGAIAAGGGGARPGSGSGSVAGDDAPRPADSSQPTDVEGATIGDDTGIRHPASRGHTMSVITMYFTWCLYFIAGVAVLGLLYHIKQGASSFSNLTTTAIKTYGVDTGELMVGNTEDPAQLFKEALNAFQKNRYSKALAGFRAVATTTHPERDRALFYIVLCEIRLGDVGTAAADFEAIPRESLSAEEFYRLGTGFEEAGALDESLRMYLAVKEEDETFRDVLHRITVIKRKRADGTESLG